VGEEEVAWEKRREKGEKIVCQHRERKERRK
jgi:hypothetical protein